jgi:hypothetical protein
MIFPDKVVIKKLWHSSFGESWHTSSETPPAAINASRGWLLWSIQELVELVSRPGHELQSLRNFPQSGELGDHAFWCQA